MDAAAGEVVQDEVQAATPAHDARHQVLHKSCVPAKDQGSQRTGLCKHCSKAIQLEQDAAVSLSHGTLTAARISMSLTSLRNCFRCADGELYC